VRGQTTRWQLPIHRLTFSSAIFISTRENSAAVVGRIGSFWVSTDIGHTSQAQVQISYFLFSAHPPRILRPSPFIFASCLFYEWQNCCYFCRVFPQKKEIGGTASECTEGKIDSLSHNRCPFIPIKIKLNTKLKIKYL